jgi:hypothetical protein
LSSVYDLRGGQSNVIAADRALVANENDAVVLLVKPFNATQPLEFGFDRFVDLALAERIAQVCVKEACAPFLIRLHKIPGPHETKERSSFRMVLRNFSEDVQFQFGWTVVFGSSSTPLGIEISCVKDIPDNPLLMR